MCFFRYHSQQAYEIVRSEMKVPLPSLRCLREWGSKIDMRQGVVEDAFIILEMAGKYMTSREKVVVLAYDEMSVNGTIEYDKRHDDIIGPHREMQVISARALFSSWKQPVFVGFDRKISREILDDIMTRFHGIGFDVVANVHDCGGGNLSLWKDLGIGMNEGVNSMKHPETGEDVFFFPDVPHLLKLIRNWLLDSGFYYKGILQFNEK